MNQKATFALVIMTLGVLSVLFSQTQNDQKPSQFSTWKQRFNIKYSSELQEMYRQRVFLQNLAKITAHNAKQSKSYQMGLNQFSAFTTEEFIQLYLNPMRPMTTPLQVESSEDSLVGDVDWSTQGAVTPVKNQGQCGACWAFASAGAVEGLTKISYGALQQLSEQQLIDCTSSYGNLGCNGGLADYSYKFIKDKGITTQQKYPYKGVKGQCAIATGQIRISGYTPVSNCNDVANALNARPISVAVDASHWSSYHSGVFDNCTTKLNFDALLVGANAESWKLKNSWGTTWGENGYIRLKRGNTCGVCNIASYPNK